MEERRILMSNNASYETIDLDLPSGLKWASVNVGSENPEDPGLYFSWGNIIGYNLGEYNFSSTNYNSTLGRSLTASITKGSSTYDAATANMGGKWRLPSIEDWNELNNNTTKTSETVNGVSCLRFISKKDSDKSILIPKYGYIIGNSRTSGTYMYYWTREYNSSSRAYVGYASSTSVSTTYLNRYFGLPVRAVFDEGYRFTYSGETTLTVEKAGTTTNTFPVSKYYDDDLTYTASINVNWITVSTSGNTFITVNLNPTTQDRTGIITLTLDGSNKTIIITVNLLGNSYEFTSQYVSEYKVISPEALTVTIPITSLKNGNFISFNIDYNNCKINNYYLMDLNSISVSGSNVLLTVPEEATSDYGGDGLSYNISLIQQESGKNIIVRVDLRYYNSILSMQALPFGVTTSSGSKTIVLNNEKYWYDPSTGEDYDVTPEHITFTITGGDWLTVTDHNDDKTYTLNWQSNSSTSYRSIVVEFIILNGNPTRHYVKLTIEQDGVGHSDNDFVTLIDGSTKQYAKKNLGATCAADPGYKFTFGNTYNETSDALTSNEWANTPGGQRFYNGSNNSINSSTFTDDYDAVTVALGSNYRMIDDSDISDFEQSSYNQIQIPKINDISYTGMANGLYNGLFGYKYCNKNDSSKFIFIPYFKSEYINRAISSSRIFSSNYYGRNRCTIYFASYNYDWDTESGLSAAVNITAPIIAVPARPIKVS